MAIEQLKAFLGKMQDDLSLKEKVLAASTADDVAKIAQELGYEVSGDELLRFSGKKVGKVTVKKKPTIVFYSTGNEISEKSKIPDWKIRNSNKHYIKSLSKNLPNILSLRYFLSSKTSNTN